jgi:hypothetical protein
MFTTLALRLDAIDSHFDYSINPNGKHLCVVSVSPLPVFQQFKRYPCIFCLCSYFLQGAEQTAISRVRRSFTST